MKAKPLLAALLGIAAAAGALADDPRAVEIVQGKCFICHGADGESSSPVFPRLAGQHAAYVARQLADYQSGKRKSRSSIHCLRRRLSKMTTTVKSAIVTSALPTAITCI